MTMTTEVQQGFDERFVEVINSAALALMVSIGHRTGLFDVMEGAQPMTSVELAEASGLDERYVREWLSAMATGRVVELDVPSASFWLPAERAQWLTRSAGADNLARIAQYISVLGAVEDDIVRCFHEGGGVPYERFARFHEVMMEESGAGVRDSLEEHVLPIVPGLAGRLEQGIDAVDLGCGRGLTLIRLAELYPASTFLGLDLSESAVGYARSVVAEKGLTNVSFGRQDLRSWDVDAPLQVFDLVTTFDAVHDQPRPQALLDGIHRSLRPGGVYLMQDIAGSTHVHENLEHPLGTFLYTISCLHCMTVSLAQGGDGLGAMWGEQAARAMLHNAGFRDVAVRQLDHDPTNTWYIAWP